MRGAGSFAKRCSRCGVLALGWLLWLGDSRAEGPDAGVPERAQDAEPSVRIQLRQLHPHEYDEIFFDPGRSTIKPVFLPFIDEIARVLRARPDVRVLLEGHCDSREAKTRKLRGIDRQRAEAVRDLILSRGGIDPQRIEIVTLGATRPSTDDRSADGLAKNRRVRFSALWDAAKTSPPAALRPPR